MHTAVNYVTQFMCNANLTDIYRYLFWNLAILNNFAKKGRIAEERSALAA